MTIYINQQ